MEIGAPELTGGGAVGLGTILVWQFIRLVGKLQQWLDSVAKQRENEEKHQRAVEFKLDEVVAAIRSIGAPVAVPDSPTPITQVPRSR